MSNVITHRQLMEWLDEQDNLLKDQIMNTPDEVERNKIYNLYHATQLFKTNISNAFKIEVEWEHNMYDEPQPNEEK